MINLVNGHGYEYPLAAEFSSQVTRLGDPRIRFVHFDFHQECSKMRWERISLLLDEVDNELQEQGHCHVSPEGRLLRMQTSIVRTNCMDCLDRTNVVQSVMARRALTHQLREMGVLAPKEVVAECVAFERIYKGIWADNADEVSRQYSGTGALKTDFTRTGKRTKSGALQDLGNSIIRYIKNNFFDGYRQDSYDLFLGNYKPKHS